MLDNPAITEVLPEVSCTIRQADSSCAHAAWHKWILNKRYARAQLPDGKLGELVDLISTIGFGD